MRTDKRIPEDRRILDECHCCGYSPESPKGVWVNRVPACRSGEERWLCDVCYGSQIGNVVERPGIHGVASLAQALGVATNMILARLDEIEKRIMNIEWGGEDQ